MACCRDVLYCAYILLIKNLISTQLIEKPPSFPPSPPAFDEITLSASTLKCPEKNTENDLKSSENDFIIGNSNLENIPVVPNESESPTSDSNNEARSKEIKDSYSGMENYFGRYSKPAYISQETPKFAEFFGRPLQRYREDDESENYYRKLGKPSNRLKDWQPKYTESKDSDKASAFPEYLTKFVPSFIPIDESTQMSHNYRYPETYSHPIYAQSSYFDPRSKEINPNYRPRRPLHIQRYHDFLNNYNSIEPAIWNQAEMSPYAERFSYPICYDNVVSENTLASKTCVWEVPMCCSKYPEPTVYSPNYNPEIHRL